MTILHNELPPNPPHLQVWYAIIARSILDENGPAYVILPDYSMDFRWGPCRWQARGSVTFPQIGDEALVMFDNRMNPWVIAWWPFNG